MAKLRPLLLTEYVPAPGVPLDACDAATLGRAMRSMSIAPAWGGAGYDIVPGSEVGIVALGSRDVVVRPAKATTDRVLFLISYALDPTKWQDRSASYATARDVVEGMAALFANELRRALRRGVLQGYRSMEDALMTVRGRVRFDDQLRVRYGRTLPLEVRFDEYTEDTDLNRVLRAALWRISRLPILSQPLRSTLAFCSSLLADTVTLVDYPRGSVPELSWNRLNEHYRVAGELALLILEATSVELAEGTARGAGFVVDMNVVFEDFVRTALREALGLRRDEFPPGNGVHARLDLSAKVRLEPDLSWWRNGRCVFVGDAKYKRITVKGINHPDLYQLLAYTVALDLPAGLLVYAVGEADRVEHVVRHAAKRLHVTTVDLSGSPQEILFDMKRIAGLVRDLAISEQTYVVPISG
jgi:5-methylcytosine-specific restriction enzyme subunit McrC